MGLLGTRAVDAHDHTGRVAAFDDGDDRFTQLVGLGIVFAAQAEAEGQIVGADIDGADTFDGEDFVEVFKTGGGFDHHDADRARIAFVMLDQASARDAPDRAPASCAGGSIAAGIGRALGFLGVVDHRHDDRFGTQIEGAHHIVGRVPRHADHARHPGLVERVDHGGQRAERVEAVLHVERDEVETGLTQNLDDRRMIEAAPGSVKNIAVGQTLLEGH